MQKHKTSGITLIALVITVIVLLILAGVTIAALTGSDSAPSKANEAKQRQDIGAAKDEVYLAAQNAQTEAYERVYVDGKQVGTDAAVTAGNASTNVGTFVRAKVYEEYKASKAKKVGLASIVATADGNITISTTDFTEYGLIDLSGGALSWITPVAITTLGEITASDTKVKETKTITLTAAINSDATESLNWRSSDDTVAIVTPTGKNTAEVRGLAGQAGNSVTITASYGDLTPVTIEISVIENTVESFVGKYAEIDGDIVGIIYADLLAKKPEKYWNNTNVSYDSIAVSKNNVKEYEISQTGVVAKDSNNNNLFDSKPRDVVKLSSTSTGTEKRFYVMGLNNILNGTSETMDWSTACGKTATTGEYTWILPSKEQWSMFGKAFEITSSTYPNYGLSSLYWSSTEYASDTSRAWRANFNGGGMGDNSKTTNYYVRLCTTF